jgi:hypothetical protein
MPDFKNLNKFLGGAEQPPGTPNIDPQKAQQVQDSFNGAFGLHPQQPQQAGVPTDPGTLEKLLSMFNK